LVSTRIALSTCSRSWRHLQAPSSPGRRRPRTGAAARHLLRAAQQHAPGRRAWAIEGTGSYGAGLARFLAERGELVLEASRTPRAERRVRGKNDTLDAVGAARAALASDRLALPRSGERREALRLLLVARRSAAAAANPGATHDLTSHRSIIPEPGAGEVAFPLRIVGSSARLDHIVLGLDERIRGLSP